MNVPILEWFGLGLAVILGIVATTLITRFLSKNYKALEKGAPKITVAVLTFAGVMVFVGLFTCPSIMGVAGLTPPWVAPAAPVPGVVPVEQIIATKEGYVLATVKNAYRTPTTFIDGALVYVSLSPPVANNSWTARAQDNTGTSGSVQITVPGVTSGTVYVTAWKSGYYSDYVSTSIPGAQVAPPDELVANIPLTQIGTLGVSQYDNNNASLSGTTITVDNDATSAYITLDIVCENVWMAIGDLRMLAIRGSSWSANSVSVAPVIISDASLASTTIDDPTLTNSTTGGWNFAGDLAFGKTLRVRWTISKTASAGSLELFRVSLDDLLGLKGYVNETGLAETVLTFTT